MGNRMLPDRTMKLLKQEDNGKQIFFLQVVCVCVCEGTLSACVNSGHSQNNSKHQKPFLCLVNNKT